MKFFAFDCQLDVVKNSGRFKMCENAEYLPFFQLMKPAEVKINPYTKQRMGPTDIPYNDRQVTQKKVHAFVVANLPDYATVIDSKQKLEEFIDNREDVNRVVLFSKKNKTTPIYKALSSEFKDRIRFGFISVEFADVIQQFPDIPDFPKIIVYKSFDVAKNEVLPSVSHQQITYDKADYKLPELKEFLAEFARSTKKEPKPEPKKEEQSKEQKQQSRKKPYSELYTDRHFNTHILDNEKACLVFFILGDNITAEVPMFNKIMREANGPLQIAVFYVNETAEDFAEFKKKYRLGKQFPQMRFYKDTLVGETKNEKSFEIYIKSKFSVVMEELHNSLEADIKEVSAAIVKNVAINFALEEKKNVLIYFYKQG